MQTLLLSARLATIAGLTTCPKADPIELNILETNVAAINGSPEGRK